MLYNNFSLTKFYLFEDGCRSRVGGCLIFDRGREDTRSTLTYTLISIHREVSCLKRVTLFMYVWECFTSYTRNVTFIRGGAEVGGSRLLTVNMSTSDAFRARTSWQHFPERLSFYFTKSEIILHLEGPSIHLFCELRPLEAWSCFQCTFLGVRVVDCISSWHPFSTQIPP